MKKHKYMGLCKLAKLLMLTLRRRRHRNKQSEATTLGSFTIPEMAIKRQNKF